MPVGATWERGEKDPGAYAMSVPFHALFMLLCGGCLLSAKFCLHYNVT